MKKKQMVLLPGWGMERSIWTPITEPLRASYDCYMVDWRGISSTQELQERIKQTIESNQLDTFIFCGWSLGAMLALEATKNDDQERVEALILVGGTSCFVADEQGEYLWGWRKRVVDRMKRSLDRNQEETLHSFYQAMFSSAEQNEGHLDAFRSMIHESFQGDHPASLQCGLDYLSTVDLRNDLQYIKTPTLLIHGAEDTICPLGAAEYMKRSLAGVCDLHVYPQTGHVPFLTHTPDFIAKVKKFVEVYGD